MTGSLAYRNNEAQILQGDVPEKYTRILPHIPSGRVLELGSAEGVLACLLAQEGRDVIALEAQSERHQAAKELAQTWKVSGIRFVCGKIQDNLAWLEGVDVLVAVRMIYYLREDLPDVFQAIAQKVPAVVLCGNRNRADRWRKGKPHEPLGQFNKYAAREGMREILESVGYEVVEEVTDGDEIVVGRLRPSDVGQSAGYPVQDHPSGGPSG